MKKSLIVLLVALLAIGGNAFAQKNVKLGHVSSAELMQIIPGKDSAQAILQKEAAEMEEQMKMMQAEIEKRPESICQQAF